MQPTCAQLQQNPLAEYFKTQKFFDCPLCFIYSSGTDFDWKETVYRFRRAGYSTDYLVDFSIVTDSKNSSWRVIDIDQVLQNTTNTPHAVGIEPVAAQTAYLGLCICLPK